MTDLDWAQLTQDGCCLGYPDSEPCGKPVRFAAIAATQPEWWLDTAPCASLGGYCCLEHAAAEPRATFADAREMYGFMCRNGERWGKAVWGLLLDNYPHPVLIDSA